MMPDTDTVLLFTHNGLGHGEQALQHKLAGTYLKLLDEHNLLPGAICFYTEGVYLAVEGSPVIETLQSLERKGVPLILCSTCLNYYNIMDKVKVGIVGGMGDILEAQQRAAKVISL
ncbi:MAG: sulfurtransferase-like selenium metabolism protein YedF [Anaerolineales bacterium]|nr:sulfurtransferase-like selenium metabolism protein YedF [Anaerolineae bacterium]PWB51477.1 MAG: sulfurtransferase-like selenium metabolism protein YedF [Anaerolineales bacterium]